MTLAFGPEAGALSPDFVAFAEWAEGKGYLSPLKFTGINIIDEFLRDLLALLVFYGLGYSIALISAGKISARFAAGYFFYWNAWSLLGTLLGVILILVGMVMPLFQTALPPLVGTFMYIVAAFMLLGFPILFWPRIVDVSWRRTAVALAGGLAIWIAAIAILAPLIVDMPNLG
ncbi:MAG: hypothetical protein WAN86_20765 [Hyphomicrobiaceae bacterium]